MLTQLTISNFAIVDELEINFNSGLTVLTGETGAGKSIIIDALDFLLGARGSLDFIKNGTSKAKVEGIFEISDKLSRILHNWFKENGFDELDSQNQLIISRELSQSGSKAKINGSIANLSHLTYIRDYIFDIHEQSSHIDLLKIEKQIEIFDSFGDISHQKLLSSYENLFEEFTIIKNKLNSLTESSEEIAKKMDFLKFQINEIKEASIVDLNEEETLLEQRKKLLNSKELYDNASKINELISGENPYNLTKLLTEIKKLIASSSSFDMSFEPYQEVIESASDSMKDLSSFTSSYTETIQEPGENLDEIEDRLDTFYRLKKKYGNTLKDIKGSLEKMEDELTTYTDPRKSKESLEKEYKQREEEIKLLGEKLTKSREKLAQEFVNKVNEELLTLGFKSKNSSSNFPLFVVEFLDCPLSKCGKEQIQFLFTANPDEEPKPLLKVASGGELSRIMLAIKSLVGSFGFTNTKTMVLDEIDIGISGEIASSVAKKLYKIARSNQVICITHQPIVAAMADEHFEVIKEIEDGTTFVNIRQLANDERWNALVSLLAPELKSKEISHDAKQYAKSLLDNANKIKNKEDALAS